MYRCTVPLCRLCYRDKHDALRSWTSHLNNRPLQQFNDTPVLLDIFLLVFGTTDIVSFSRPLLISQLAICRVRVHYRFAPGAIPHVIAVCSGPQTSVVYIYYWQNKINSGGWCGVLRGSRLRETDVDDDSEFCSSSSGGGSSSGRSKDVNLR